MFLDLLDNVTIKYGKLQNNLERSEEQQREQVDLFESNLKEKQKEVQTSLDRNAELCRRDLQTQMQNFRNIFLLNLYFQRIRLNLNKIFIQTGTEQIF